jgi:hypothetical protein
MQRKLLRAAYILQSMKLTCNAPVLHHVPAARTLRHSSGSMLCACCMLYATWYVARHMLCQLEKEGLDKTAAIVQERSLALKSLQVAPHTAQSESATWHAAHKHCRVAYRSGVVDRSQLE